MNLTLHLPPELEAKLREQAQATGKPPEEVALQTLTEQFLTDPSVVAISRDEWQDKFREWMAAMPSGNPDADLSRESIYEGRGE